MEKHVAKLRTVRLALRAAKAEKVTLDEKVGALAAEAEAGDAAAGKQLAALRVQRAKLAERLEDLTAAEQSLTAELPRLAERVVTEASDRRRELTRQAAALRAAADAAAGELLLEALRVLAPTWSTPLPSKLVLSGAAFVDGVNSVLEGLRPAVAGRLEGLLTILCGARRSPELAGLERQLASLPPAATLAAHVLAEATAAARID